MLSRERKKKKESASQWDLSKTYTHTLLHRAFHNHMHKQNIRHHMFFLPLQDGCIGENFVPFVKAVSQSKLFFPPPSVSMKESF